MDNQDHFPYPNWGFARQGWLYRAGKPPQPDPANPTAAYLNGLLWENLKTISAYRCPADPDTAPGFKLRPNKLSTYIMNGAVCGFVASRYPAYQTTEMNPSSYVYWEPDNTQGAIAYNDASSTPSPIEGPGRRHVSGCIVGRADGGSQFLKHDSYNALNKAGPNILWCDPDRLQTGGYPNGTGS
jgi:hypothetical protein